MDIRMNNPPPRGKYRGYDEEEMTRAFIAVKENTMSIRKAALTFGIPKTTLLDRLSGRVHVDVVRSGTGPLFSQEQEALLASHLKTMGEVGYGYSRQETINLASDFAICLGLRDKEHPLTDRWLYRFLGRWPDLKMKKPRSLDVARAKSATRQVIDNYFAELQNILTKYNLHDKPQLIFNIDEKGLNTEHKPPKIISGKYYKAQAITSGRSKTVTLIGCVSAVGQQIPPFFVFPGARMLDSLMEGATPGAAGTVSPTGWSNTDIFADYMESHLVKYLPSRDSDTPLLVLYDGHKSHVSLRHIEWAKSNNIILFVLPPHCSHLLQPLDVSCFGPLEVAWNSACHHYMRESGGRHVTRYDVCRLACKVYATTLSASNIQAAFKKCGISPLDPHAVSDSQVAPATTFPCDSQTSQVKASASTEAAENFLLQKGGKILENVQNAQKRRNTLSKVVAGKAITEDDIVEKIKVHQEAQKNKPKEKQQKPEDKGKRKSTLPVPSTSGIPSKTRKIIVQGENTQTDTDSSDDEMSEVDKCAMCKKFRPDFSNKPSIKIVNWG